MSEPAVPGWRQPDDDDDDPWHSAAVDVVVHSEDCQGGGCEGECDE